MAWVRQEEWSWQARAGGLVMGQEEALIEGQSDKGFGIEQRGILDPPQGNKEALVAPTGEYPSTPRLK